MSRTSWIARMAIVRSARLTKPFRRSADNLVHSVAAGAESSAVTTRTSASRGTCGHSNGCASTLNASG